MIAVDPLKVEAARVAISDAVKTSYNKWKKVSVAVKDAWPTQGLLDEPLVRQWIIDAMGATQLLATPRKETGEAAEAKAKADPKADAIKVKAAVEKALKERDDAQATAKKFFNDVVKYAYPAPVIVQPAPELSPEQAEANAAQVIATQAAIDKGNASNAAAQSVTQSKIAKAESDTAALKAKAAEAAAKLDPTQAEAAALMQAEAEAKAAEAKAKAEEADAKKAEAEAAKAVMVATQVEAKAKAAAVQASKMVEAILKDLDALITRVQGYKASIKGGDDLEAGLLGLKTDLLIDNSL
jgi:colicin import membrane protein